MEKVFFWDFAEEFSEITLGKFVHEFDEETNEGRFEIFPKKEKKRNFFDLFYNRGIDELLKGYENFYHGIITNGDLNYQIRVLNAKNVGHLFHEKLMNSPFFVAKDLSDLPEFFLMGNYKTPLTLDKEKNLFNLIGGLIKPSEYMYEMVAMKFGLNKKDCYVVRTGYKDFLAAKNAGMNSIHIRGWEDKKIMPLVKEFGKPDYVINKSNIRNGLKNIFDKLK